MIVREHDIADRIRERLREASAVAFAAEVERRRREGDRYTRDPRAEAIILNDWRFAYLYSREFIRGRWPEFEEAIGEASPATDITAIRSVYNYARHVRGGRMPSAEKHVVNDAATAGDYARNVLGLPRDTDVLPFDQADEAPAAQPVPASLSRPAF